MVKKIYLFLDENNRVLECSSNSNEGDNIKCVEVPVDHEVLRNPEVFVYVDGKLEKDVEYQKQLLAESEKEAHKPSLEEVNQDLQKRLDDAETVIVQLLDLNSLQMIKGVE